MFDTALAHLSKGPSVFVFMILRTMIDQHVCVSTSATCLCPGFSVFSLLSSITKGQFSGQLTAYHPILGMKCVYTGM